MKKLRISAVLAATALLCVATSASAKGKKQLKHLPASVQMVLSVDTAKVMKTAFAKQAMKSMNNGANFDKLRKMAGIDVRKDLHSIVVASEDPSDDKKMVVIAKGRLPKKKLLRAAKKSGSSFVQKQHRGIAYYVVGNDLEFAFVGGSVVLGPAGGMVRRVIDVNKGREKSLLTNAAMMKAVAGAKTGKHLWMVFLPNGAIKAALTKQMMGQGFEGMSAFIDFSKGMDALIRMTMATAQAASMLSGMVQMGVAGAAGTPEAKRVGLGAVLKKLAITTNQANIDIALSLTSAELKTLSSKLSKMAKP